MKKYWKCLKEEIKKPAAKAGLLCAANQIRTDTPVVWALPPQGSASTNFAMAAYLPHPLSLSKREGNVN